MALQTRPVDPRVKRTRQLIQQAFMDLMRERSFQDLTIGDIADRATINRATFYAHYADKFDLLDNTLREQFHALLTEKLPPGALWSLDHLRDLIRAVFEYISFFSGDCHQADRALDPILEGAIHEEIAHVLLGWFTHPTYQGTAGVLAKTQAIAWSWAILGQATSWSRGDRQPSAEEMTRQLVTLLVH